jgi:hypothetical protein
MLGLESRPRGAVFGSSGNPRWGRTNLSRRSSPGGPSTALLVTGAVVIGLGLLAWSYLGPDLRRYIKIHNM